MNFIKKIKAKILAVLYFTSIVFAITLLGAPYAFFSCYLRNDWHRFTKICCPFFRKTFKAFGIRLVTLGAENIPREEGFVIVSNHQSFLDINVIFAGLSHSAFFAKAELWKIPYFGWILDKTGSIPIFRANPKKNAGMGEVMARRISKGYNFCIFPEGKRSGDGVMQRFQNGIFRIAKSHPVKILPITISGSGKVLPKKGLGLYPGEVRLVIHKPILPEEYENKTMEELRDSTRQIIESALPYAQK